MDCMEGMKTFPDKYFDLAIVDPPYGLNTKLTKGGGNHLKFKNDNKITNWDNVPNSKYFIELFRISINQIIWGGNYFELPVFRCPIIWDKLQSVNNFSAIELAWSSFDSPAKIFKQRQAGFIGEPKIHPTQKPVQLYKWILHNYAKPDFKIIDTHVGSASSIIAFLDFGCDWIGFEIDEDYHKAATERIKIHQMQTTLF